MRTKTQTTSLPVYKEACCYLSSHPRLPNLSHFRCRARCVRSIHLDLRRCLPALIRKALHSTNQCPFFHNLVTPSSFSFNLVRRLLLSVAAEGLLFQSCLGSHNPHRTAFGRDITKSLSIERCLVLTCVGFCQSPDEPAPETRYIAKVTFNQTLLSTVYPTSQNETTWAAQQSYEY